MHYTHTHHTQVHTLTQAVHPHPDVPGEPRGPEDPTPRSQDPAVGSAVLPGSSSVACELRPSSHLTDRTRTVQEVGDSPSRHGVSPGPSFQSLPLLPARLPPELLPAGSGQGHTWVWPPEAPGQAAQPHPRPSSAGLHQPWADTPPSVLLHPSCWAAARPFALPWASDSVCTVGFPWPRRAGHTDDAQGGEKPAGTVGCEAGRGENHGAGHSAAEAFGTRTGPRAPGRRRGEGSGSPRGTRSAPA